MKTEENEEKEIYLKVQNNNHPIISNNKSDFETPNFNSRVLKPRTFYKNMQVLNDQTDEDDDDMPIEDDMKESHIIIDHIGSNRMS